MKQNKDKDGDLVKGCAFFLASVQQPVEIDYFKHILNEQFTHSRCFWRMKQNKDKDGDVVTGCIFFLIGVEWPVKKDYFNHILNIECHTLCAVLIVVLDSEKSGSREWQPAVLIAVPAHKMKFLMKQQQMQILQCFFNKFNRTILSMNGYSCTNHTFLSLSDVDKCVRCPEDQYANREQNQCIPKPVVFLDYKEPLGMALALMALCFSAFTTVVLGVFVKHHDTPIVKANNRKLSYILLISLIFCFLCTLLFIGHPNSATCVMQQITFGVVFTVAISTVLAKTVTVLLAFKLTVPGRRMSFFQLSRAPKYIITICLFIQIILCAIWLQFSPPFIDTDPHSEPGQIIIVCNKGSVTAFYCVLGYHGFLALGSFIVAFLARNLPDTFNEAKMLTFSMFLFCSVWVTFLPVYHSTKGKVMGQRHSQRPLAASGTFGGDGLGDRPSCASQRRVATRGTSTRQLSLATCCWRPSSFMKVLACLPGGSGPGCRLTPGVSRNTAAPLGPPCAAVRIGLWGPRRDPRMSTCGHSEDCDAHPPGPHPVLAGSSE
ncbi:hypothetical protein ACRRTK_001090 [Alexandromys fortis]